MVGLSKFDEVDYVGCKHFSYKRYFVIIKTIFIILSFSNDTFVHFIRGYYVMIWKHKISLFSKSYEEVHPPNEPDLKPDSKITIEYNRKKKVRNNERNKEYYKIEKESKKFEKKLFIS